MAEVAVTAPPASRVSYVDWPAIFAGAIVGSAVAFVFTAFGTALGLSLISPFRGESTPGPGLVIAIGLWIVWVAGTSFLAAGYIAGRLRHRVPDATEHEVSIRDGAHGVIAWGMATLIGAALLTLGVYGLGNIASRAAPALANAASATSMPTRGGQDAARGGQDEASSAILVEKMFGPGEEMAKPGADVARRTATRVLAASAAAGKMSDTDRAYLVKLVATRSGVDEAAAQGRVDQAFKETQALTDKAKQAANVARKVGIVSAFIIAASLLIGLAAAWWAATRGGRHRDEQTIFAWLQWRR